MSSKKKENIVIYGSLIAAIICLIYAGVDYYKDLSDSVKVKDEIKEAFKEMAGPEETEGTKAIELPEPEELQKTDKLTIIKNRINDIKDRKREDDLLNYTMIRTWGAFEVMDTTYVREVTDNYYMYITNIKIPNKEAQLPVDINEELSTEEYNVITLKTFLVKNKDTYSFKHFEK